MAETLRLPSVQAPGRCAVTKDGPRALWSIGMAMNPLFRIPVPTAMDFDGEDGNAEVK